MNKVFSSAAKRTNPKIFGLAKNYFPPGAKDLPTIPLVFSKPASSILYNGEKLLLHTNNQINYEIELGVMIGKKGKNISRHEYLDYIGGYFLCFDMTDMTDILARRATGAPWELAKGQDGYLPISDFIPKEEIQDPHNVNIQLKINNKLEIDDYTRSMFYKIEYISKFMTLNEGDFILTGTPKAGPVFHGDQLDAKISYNGKKLAQIVLDVINHP